MKKEMTTNKELLFNLLKKKDSGEIKVVVNGDGAVFLREKGSAESIFLVQIEGLTDNDFANEEPKIDYEKEYNEKFTENFYKEKGLVNCWYKDCSLKIYQAESDYKAVNIECKDKHKRYICLECYASKISK